MHTSSQSSPLSSSSLFSAFGKNALFVVGLALTMVFSTQTQEASSNTQTSGDLIAVPLPGRFYGAAADASEQSPSTPDVVSTCAAWQVRSPIPINTVYGASATSDSLSAYLAGGYSFEGTVRDVNQFRRYDLASNSWTALAPMPDVNTEASAVYSPINNKVYVFGGENAATGYVKNNTRIYNIATNTWSAGAVLPALRAFMASGYFNGKIYLIGGYDSTNVTPQTQVWEYDPIANTWNTTRLALPHAIGGAGFGIINGHFYVAGGRDTVVATYNGLWDYNIAANTWTQRANIPAGVNAPGGDVVDGQLWLFGGGINGNAFGASNISQVYDPASNTWSVGPTLNVGRSFIGGTSIGNTFLAAGGYNALTSVNTTETTACVATPTVLSAVSQKTHGGAGVFDINLPLTGAEGIECRRGGGASFDTHQIVVTFASPVTDTGVTVTSPDGGAASATQAISGNIIIVNLSGGADQHNYIVTLINVNDGINVGNVAIPIGILRADVNADRFVNSGDSTATKNRSGQGTDGTNLRFDVNTDGVINSGDIIVVDNASGDFLP